MSKITSKQLSKVLRSLANPDDAEFVQRFFKTDKGEYGEGDKFLGIRVPVIRQQVKKYRDIELKEVLLLLTSKFHEERLCAVFLLVHKFTQGDEKTRVAIYKAYLKNTRYINSWDVVDGSAHQIVGGYLIDKDKKRLYKLAKSKDLWERRIAIIATFYFIKRDIFEDTLVLSELLLEDKEDLIHKAVGWMLRELGKRDIVLEKKFLKIYYKNMPRTMLRYAIEKFPEKNRKKYLAGTI